MRAEAGAGGAWVAYGLVMKLPIYIVKKYCQDLASGLPLTSPDKAVKKQAQLASLTLAEFFITDPWIPKDWAFTDTNSHFKDKDGKLEKGFYSFTLAELDSYQFWERLAKRVQSLGGCENIK
jgi:hypothetical protein